ncbi:L-seryl-tRNA(Sec) selenium transferase [Nesterenkonia natronophila]|uniref:L-seryl-tRNA(Sec) selenium transferase n=1 Tax=Nesterenkonia natronophila TaxID=2174932 RepID=A0A3A4FZU6_9MICC|nr:L-seryl-tRNA(Sec) selenium transferase [Nesterenkonia natronophila]RJN31459.1 L-seryl-tRNA(Sec) selenium transferase [Nesterenkonia natronophila]
MVSPDPRRLIPGTDTLLARPHIRDASAGLSPHVLRHIITQTQQRARQGRLAPDQVETEVLSRLVSYRPSTMRRVVNATGVVVHTNLGRAPLSEGAREAVAEAAGYVDVEIDLNTGRRSGRGGGARRALLAACPQAEDALIVNNGAAALALAAAALVGTNEVVISRGELVEIGAGFRLPELIESTGARLRETGTTNRTHLSDYVSALSRQPSEPVAAVLKVHPSNYRIAGFTSSVNVRELAALCKHHGVPLIVDAGSGLLNPDPTLPEEPDLTSALADGADLVIASGDKLLGGPQAGLLLGSASIIARLAKHPLARAVRTDKLTLAALEGTLNGGQTPVEAALHIDPDTLLARAQRMAEALSAEVVPHEGRVGGGGGTEVPLPGWAVRLPEEAAAPLRAVHPAILTRISDSSCLLDLRCVPEAEDDAVLSAVEGVLRALRDPTEELSK